MTKSAIAIVAAMAITAGCAAGGDDSASPSGTGGAGGTGEGGGNGASGGVGAMDGGTDAPPDVPVNCMGVEDCAGYNGACTVGGCVDGFCQPLPANDFGPCEDGKGCTISDTCQAGVCIAGNQMFCASPDSCHLGICDESSDSCKVIAGNDGGQCDDGDPCTSAGSCNAGVCSKGLPVDCSALNTSCSTGVCDPAIGCKSQPKNDGLACDDGMASPCTTGQCQAGLCEAVPTNDGIACDDMLFCTVSETCLGGLCGGGLPNPCAPPGGCYIASCDESADLCTAVPGNDGAPCDDFSPCTESTTCSNGACINGNPVNDGLVCNDGTDCTTGEFCTAGVCGGGIGPAVYFAEDFADNTQGWVLGPEWEIGPAQASFNGTLGGNNPATDYGPSADNGVAGVVLGDNAGTGLHAYYFLESPTFNTQNAAGPVILGFYRWLNSDYPDFMTNIIQVYNGAQWVDVWVQPNDGTPILDAPSGMPPGPGWTFVSHDLTAYKNPSMRVRFGFKIESGGVYTIGSWNIDDVLVAGAACP